MLSFITFKDFILFRCFLLNYLLEPIETLTIYSHSSELYDGAKTFTIYGFVDEIFDLES